MSNDFWGLRRAAPALALLVILLGTHTAVAQVEVLLRFERGSLAERRVDQVLDSLESLASNAKRPSPPDSIGFGESRPGAPAPPRPYEFQDPPARQRLVLLQSAFAKTYWQRWEGMLAVVDDSKRVEPRTGVPDDPGLSEQWHLERIEALAAWAYTRGGRTPSGHRIVIGVIEANGFDVDHAELRDQFYVNPGEIADNGVDDDGNGLIDDVRGYDFDNRQPTFEKNRHGSHVSAILAGASDNGLQTTGLNAEARLIPFRISNISHWIAALDYLTGLRTRFNATAGREGAFVVAANCSLGATGDCRVDGYEELNLAIDRAGAAGIITVGAASNQGSDQDAELDVPSSCVSDFLIAVTATSRTDSIYRASGYSNTQVDLGAPGADFRSIDIELFGRIDNTFNSTSGATPQVTGALALLYGVDCGAVEARSITAPAATALELKQFILDEVDLVADLGGKTLSGGRLNVRRAVEALIGSGDCQTDRVIVKYEGGSPPTHFPLGNGDSLRLRDTISSTWGLYRYDARAWDASRAAILARDTRVSAAALDFPLLSTAQRLSFTDDADSLEASPFARGVSQIEQLRRTGAISPSALASMHVAAAPFVPSEADRYLLNAEEVPGNDLDDDANGFVDDYAVTRLDGGLSGTAAGYGLSACANADLIGGDCAGQQPLQPFGKTFQLQGHSYGDWLKGAGVVFDRAQAYFTSNGARGMPLTVFAADLRGGASSGVTDSGFGESPAALAVAQLMSVGVLTILPATRDDASAGSLASAAVGALVVRSRGETSLATLSTSLTARSSATLPCAAAGEIRSLRGQAVGVADLAAFATALRSVDCRLPASTEAEAAERSRSLLRALTSEVAGASTAELPQFNPNLSSALYYKVCAGDEAGCRLLSLSPNPLNRGTTAQVYTASPAGQMCPAVVIDAAGRQVPALGNLATGDADVQTLDSSLLPAGLYFLRLGDGKAVKAYPFVVLD